MPSGSSSKMPLSSSWSFSGRSGLYWIAIRPCSSECTKWRGSGVVGERAVGLRGGSWSPDVGGLVSYFGVWLAGDEVLVALRRREVELQVAAGRRRRPPRGRPRRPAAAGCPRGRRARPRMSERTPLAVSIWAASGASPSSPPPPRRSRSRSPRRSRRRPRSPARPRPRASVSRRWPDEPRGARLPAAACGGAPSLPCGSPFGASRLAIGLAEAKAGRASPPQRSGPRIDSAPPCRGERNSIYWWETEPVVPGPPLEGTERADVCIVGGGYTGMWTAYFLKRADPSLDVAIVERSWAGSGASGHNDGYAMTVLDMSLHHLVERHGPERAGAAHEAVAQSVVEIGEFCDEHGVDCRLRPLRVRRARRQRRPDVAPRARPRGRAADRRTTHEFELLRGRRGARGDRLADRARAAARSAAAR